MSREPVFIGAVPTVEIDEEQEMVLVRCGKRRGAWKPEVFRAFLDIGFVTLSKWEARRVVPFRGKKH